MDDLDLPADRANLFEAHERSLQPSFPQTLDPEGNRSFHHKPRESQQLQSQQTTRKDGSGL